MTHKFDRIITNLRWLEQQDLPIEIWETYCLPIIDRLDILIGTLRSYILLEEEGYDIDKLIKELMQNENE